MTAKTEQQFGDTLETEPTCGVWDYEGEYFECEPHFSWRRCDVCGSTLGGNRHDVIAWLEGAREHDYSDEYRWEGEACEDCIS